MNKFFSAFALAALLSWIAGCASTPEKRAEERPGALRGLSKEQRDAALAGKLAPGMNKDAVYVAIGKPARVEGARDQKGRKKEKWIYSEVFTEDIPGWQVIERQQMGGTVVTQPIYEPVPIHYQKDTFEVVFDDKGRVLGWRQL